MKLFLKVRIGIVENLLAAMLNPNSLKRNIRQPLCGPSNLREMEKWENQSLDDLLDLGPRLWGVSRGVTDQHPTHNSITKLDTVVLHAYKSGTISKLLSWIH